MFLGQDRKGFWLLPVGTVKNKFYFAQSCQIHSHVPDVISEGFLYNGKIGPSFACLDPVVPADLINFLQEFVKDLLSDHVVRSVGEWSEIVTVLNSNHGDFKSVTEFDQYKIKLKERATDFNILRKSSAKSFLPNPDKNQPTLKREEKVPLFTFVPSTKEVRVVRENYWMTNFLSHTQILS